jgi:hypothetical protein
MIAIAWRRERRPAPKRSKPAERIGFISPCCCQPTYVATAVEELQREVQNDQDRELEASLHGDRFSNPNAT